jgi:AcrR family transcriptional regulator
VPPPNDQRRGQLTDAAIALLAEAGVHGVTHRSVEKRAALPVGTASNYFRSREALLVATAERIVALHRADVDAAARDQRPVPAGRSGSRQLTIDLIAGSLLAAATVHRDRYLAIFELRLEGLRRPALAATLEALAGGMVGFTARHHADLGLDIPPAAVPTLLTLYGGALFTLVSSAPGQIGEAAVREVAGSIVRAALG